MPMQDPKAGIWVPVYATAAPSSLGTVTPQCGHRGTAPVGQLPLCIQWAGPPPLVGTRGTPFPTSMEALGLPCCQMAASAPFLPIFWEMTVSCISGSASAR